MITEIGTWAIIGFTYAFTSLLGFIVGINIQLYQRKKKEKEIRKDLFNKIASNEPYTMTILEAYKEKNMIGLEKDDM